MVYAWALGMIPRPKLEAGHDIDALEAAYRAALSAYHKAVARGVTPQQASTLAEQVRIDTYKELTDGRPPPEPFDD